MKVAVVLAAPWIPGSVDMTRYLHVLQQMGHEAIMICLDRSQGPAGFTVYAEARATLELSTFYESLLLDAAIAFTWFNNPGIVTALRQAGVRVLNRGDSDGLLSIRDFPAHHIRVRMSGVQSVVQHVTGWKHLLQRYWLKHRHEDQYRLDCLANADFSVLETNAAADHVKGFLVKHGRDDLIPRVKVVPHFVNDDFLNQPVSASRENSVVAIGRWEDPQKNAKLLARAIAIYLKRQPQTRFFVIGPEQGRAAFARLVSKYPQVTFTGLQTPANVRKYLSTSRVLLSSSRWEGSPVVGNEALAMGAAVVGTPIPAFVDICNRGKFGTVSKSHTPFALAAGAGVRNGRVECRTAGSGGDCRFLAAAALRTGGRR